jgi:hypothetical protein
MPKKFSTWYSQSTEVMPSEKSFYSPTPAVAAQRTTVLRRRPAVTAMRRDQLDAIALSQVSIQTTHLVCINPVAAKLFLQAIRG